MRDPRGLDSPWEARTNLAGQAYPEQMELEAKRDAATARWSDEPDALPSPRQVFLDGAWAMLDALRIYGIHRTLPEAQIERLANRYPLSWESSP